MVNDNPMSTYKSIFKNYFKYWLCNSSAIVFKRSISSGGVTGIALLPNAINQCEK